MTTTNSLRVGHSADWHLLELQYGRRDRAGDFLFAALYLIDAAAAAGVKVLTVAGDVLNKAAMNAGLFRSLRIIDKRLRERGVIMLVITGNHDAGDPHWFGEYAAMAKDFGAQTNIIPLGLHAGGVRICGFDFIGFDHCAPEDLLQRVTAAAPAAVLVIHAALDVVSSGSSSSTSVSSTTLPLQKFAYVACGDIHIPQTAVLQSPEGTTVCAMPGSIELVTGDEPLEKTFFVFDLVADAAGRPVVQNMVTVPIQGQRPIVPIRIDREEDMESAIARLRAAAPRNPIVFVRFNPEVIDARVRLNAVLAGSDAILRVAPYDDEQALMTSPGRIAGVDAKAAGQATLLEAFEKLCPSTARYHALASRLLANPSAVDTIIDGYATEALLPKQNPFSASPEALPPSHANS